MLCIAPGNVDGATALEGSLVVPENAEYALFICVYPKDMQV